MRLSDSLRSKRGDLLDRMEAVSEKAAAEERLFTDQEQAEFDGLRREVATLDKQLETQLAAEELRRGGKGKALQLLNERGEPLTVLKNTDKLADRHRGVSRELMNEFGVGHIVKGLATGIWDGRDVLQRAMNEGSGAAGQFAVPAPLSAAWLDLARASAVCSQAGAIVVPMTSQTLRIAGLATDVAPAFRAELTDFPTSNNTFRALDLRARSIGVISEMSVELLADAPNGPAMVETSLLAAMGVAFDFALLAGSGNVTAPADDPCGILLWPGIGQTAAAGTATDYSDWLGAMKGIANANHVPATVIDSPDTTYHLAGLPTGIAGDRTPLRPPAPYESLQKLQTTAMPAGTSLVGDFACCGWGLRESIVVEASRVSGDSLTKGKVQIRCMARLDTFVAYAAAFFAIAGITYT